MGRKVAVHTNVAAVSHTRRTAHFLVEGILNPNHFRHPINDRPMPSTLATAERHLASVRDVRTNGCNKFAPSQRSVGRALGSLIGRWCLR